VELEANGRGRAESEDENPAVMLTSRPVALFSAGVMILSSCPVSVERDLFTQEGAGSPQIRRL
jgi:hypothetical protein